MPAPRLVFNGDSLTDGFGVPTADHYPSQVLDLLSASYGYSYSANVAIGGQTVAQMIITAPGLVDTKYIGNLGTPNIDPFWGGTNDLYQGATAAQVITRISTYVSGRLAVGWKVIVLSILPRSQTGLPVTFEADRQTVNASLRATYPNATAYPRIYTGASPGVIFCDVGDDPTIGQPGDELNLTYYFDGVHLTQAGYAIVAGDYVKPAIDLFAL